MQTQGTNLRCAKILSLSLSTMGTHNLPSFLGAYNPYIGGLKPSFFMFFWGPRVTMKTSPIMMDP